MSIGELGHEEDFHNGNKSVKGNSAAIGRVLSLYFKQSKGVLSPKCYIIFLGGMFGNYNRESY